MTAIKSDRAAASSASRAESLQAIDPRDVVSLLRSTVLELDASDIEFHADVFNASGNPASVWGLIVETGYADAVASLIVLADGSASLYVTDGSGTVGCGANREVRRAVQELLAVADDCVALTTATDDASFPPPGSLRFHFLTTAGRRSLEVRLEDLHNAETKLGTLYFAGQRVIQAMERTGAGQSIEQEIRLAQAALNDVTMKGSSPCLSVGSAVHRLRR